MCRHDKSTCVEKVDVLNGRQRSFYDMMSHADKIASDEFRLKQLMKVSQRIKSAGLHVDMSELVGIFGRQVCNAFAITDNCFNPIGLGVYLRSSCLDHSCRPNAAAIFTDGNRIQIRALKEIASDEEVLINYLDLKMSKTDRQEYLSDKYYFECQCPKCILDFDNFDYDLVDKLDNDLNEIMKNGDQCDWSAVSTMAGQMLTKCEQLFNGYHPVLTVQMMRTLQIKIFEKVLPPNESGQILTKDKLNDLRPLVDKCKEHIRVTHGLEHSLYTYDFKQIISWFDN